MMRVSRGFNTYLLVLLLLGLIGCASPDGTKKDKAGKVTSDDKKYSLLRLHLETSPNATAPGKKIMVFRQAPFALNIKEEPVLDEAYILNAQVIETEVGYSIRVQYDDHGKLTLDMTSSGNRGRRLAVYSAFWPTGATNAEIRWLAAPLMSRPIKDGYFTFTPDATLEEARIIVRGVNKLAKKVRD